MFSGYRTFIGLAIAAVPTFAGLFGFDVAPGFTEQATEAVTEFVTMVGLAVAFYGRLKAQAPGWLIKKFPQQ